jgi:hypothetical protein
MRLRATKLAHGAFDTKQYTAAVTASLRLLRQKNEVGKYPLSIKKEKKL